MGDWNVANANALLPANLTAAIHVFADLASQVLSSAKADLAKVASLPGVPDLPDPLSTAAGALLDSLESLLTGTKIHVIAIPIVKMPPTPAPSRLPPTVTNLQQWLNVEFGSTVETAKAYQTLVAGTGGNAGFYRAFAESFFDQTDANRPQYFNQTDAVTMAVVMAGASSYASIAQAASVFDQLFRPKGAVGSLNGRVTPTPQNVSAKPVISATGASIAVRVEWDAPKAVFTFPYYGGLGISVLRYAVIRLTGQQSMSVTTVLDIFPTQDLTVGMVSKKGTVVAVGSGRNSSYVDTTPPPTDGSPVYYCVAWETKITEPSGTATSKFDKVSTVAKTVQVAPPPGQTGSPPDWTAFGAAANAFPALAASAQIVIERAKLLVNGRPSSTSRLADTLKVVAAMADRLEGKAADLLDDVDALSASLSRPLPELFLTRITSGTGGNAFLMSELARRLGNTSDTTRPPFDNGEYVCGVCFVAGAPRLADLAAAIAFFDALFGPAALSNPLMALINAIDTAVTAVETTVFGPSMQPLPPAVASTVDPLTGRPPVPVTPVIADSGAAVSTDSVENPNAGNTNVVPVSELC